MASQNSTQAPIQYNNLESLIVPIVSNVPPNTINKNVTIVFWFVSCVGDKDAPDLRWLMAADADLNSLLERPSNLTDILQKSHTLIRFFHIISEHSKKYQILV